MSACMSSQMAYAHGRMTMLPRAGPVSASSARATTSWYHWGKSSPWGVSTASLATVGPASFALRGFGTQRTQARRGGQSRLRGSAFAGLVPAGQERHEIPEPVQDEVGTGPAQLPLGESAVVEHANVQPDLRRSPGSHVVDAVTDEERPVGTPSREPEGLHQQKRLRLQVPDQLVFGVTTDDVVNEAFRIIVPENPLDRVRGIVRHNNDDNALGLQPVKDRRHIVEQPHGFGRDHLISLRDTGHGVVRPVDAKRILVVPLHPPMSFPPERVGTFSTSPQHAGRNTAPCAEIPDLAEELLLNGAVLEQVNKRAFEVEQHHLERTQPA